MLKQLSSFSRFFVNLLHRSVDDPTIEPIRAELFSIERLEQQADSMAAAQGHVTRKPARGRDLLQRVKSNQRVLIRAYRKISEAILDESAITPAAEWLVDNFHIVEDQLREIRDDLPPAFYRELPKLTIDPLAGFPRVYGLAWAFVAHTDSRFDPDWLARFIKAYQKVEPLYIGEVWAFAISLRIVLVENLRRLTERIMRGRADQRRADDFADALLGLRGKTRRDPTALLSRYEERPLPQAFAVQLLHRLRDQDASVAPVLDWLEKRLAMQDTNPERIIRTEHQMQTATNATVRNIITSMRLLSTMDWTQFFENVCVVDEILRADTPFAEMDFVTRDLYRHAIEELSRGSGLSEADVAHRVVMATRRAAQTPTEQSTVERARRTDPGYYLVSSARKEFEREIGFRVRLRHRLVRLYLAYATPGYLGSIAITTALALAIPLALSFQSGEKFFLWLAFGILGLVPASDLAISLVNRFVTDCVGPKPIPKLNFATGVPATTPTLVVMPTLLNNLTGIEEQLSHLEIHYLGNADGHLQFGLLTDWTDAKQESCPDDETLTTAAFEGIQRLNQQYGAGPGGSARFLMFHRRRLWNESEKVWMGWERKRGKIHELNRLLRGEANTTFVLSVGNPGQVRRDIRYVVTLDVDTRMARGAVYRLVGAMAHPLNRPCLDPKMRRVVAGYGIMQPRITPVLPVMENGSLYQRIFSGPAGIDPYAFAVSDVYQDLFHEGSYVGKGIYEVDAFEGALGGRVPENAMLSHDLFEGLYARTALLSDVEFFEEFPPHYEAVAARQHRWMRGDWQLLPRLFSANLPWIGRWKMIDNLRRSLSAPAAFLLLAGVWISPHAWLWAGFVLLTMAIPAFLSAILNLLPGNRHVSMRHHYRGLADDFSQGAAQVTLNVVFLAHQAWISADATARTLYRLLIGRAHLLQWVSAAQVNRFDNSAGAFYRRMVAAPILAVIMAVSLFLWGPAYLIPSAVFFVVCWFFSPLVARWVSTPLVALTDRPLLEKDRRFFRLIARRTWCFFETFVNVENHFLPPDNFQEVPLPVVARRTSPTNIGLYLLAAVTARDLGWMGLLDTLDRLENTLNTVKALKRYQGHLFNWYDTRDLRPLEPFYVSTVDSGNLAGHLLTLASACRDVQITTFQSQVVFEGARDVLNLIRESSLEISDDLLRSGTVTVAHWRETLEALEAALTGEHLVEATFKAETLVDMAQTLLNAQPQSEATLETLQWCQLLVKQLRSHFRDIHELATDQAVAAVRQRLDDIIRFAQRTVGEMNFKFLFDPIKKIFSIGYSVADEKLDGSYYDLLASEARLASFIAIAKGDVPSLHWFRLTRSFVVVQGGLALVSWSGSMFEYLMPSLVMREPAGSLLYQTARLVIKRQISYGKEKKVPWGISESGYNARDMELTYQYSNFGVPGLGLKRGLSKDLLIAPYATALASMMAPVEAAENLRRLAKTGATGRYGYYEALDYTPARLPENEKVAVIRAYMAHHQGMSLVAFANLLNEGVMRRRFHEESIVQATELLLQERMPRSAGVAQMRSHSVAGEAKIHDTSPMVSRHFTSAHDSPPRTHLLSNGRYSVMLTAAGSGYSTWRDFAVTRWREDSTKDARGTFIFIRDVESEDVWSAAYQPRGVEPDRYEVDFSDERAQFVRRDGDIVTTMEVVVSSEDDVEIRRVSLKNDGGHTREIEITSYAEIVLAPQGADLAHPVFSNLFVETQFIPAVNGLICTRRPRSPEDPSFWAAHVMAVAEPVLDGMEYESDRARFLGRGREIRTPLSVVDGKPLTNSAGAVLDPIVSLRHRVRIRPGETVRVAFSTLVTSSREKTLALADKYHDPAMFERALTLAWTQAQVQRHYLGAELKDIHLFQELARRLLYPHAAMRASQEILKKNRKGPDGLWPHGISGDLPIVLVRIDEAEDKDIVRQLLRAHEYWRMKNLDVDLVILNEKIGSYQQELQETLENLVRTGQASLSHQAHDPHGGVFILRSDRLSTDDRILILTAARVILLSHHGTLVDQLERQDGAPMTIPVPTPHRARVAAAAPQLTADKTLEFFNGLGGFADDGREYRTMLGAGQWTPAPWVNVIANPQFGFIASESGAGYTWSENSRENKITPWSNDPVSDTPGEVFYVRDEETGELWTPTVLPIREEAWPYLIAHGQGYSRFEHTSHGIKLELLQFVPADDPIKISRLRITNVSGRSRRLSVTAYVEWVLGVSSGASAPYIVTERDEKTGALLARNMWNSEFAGRVAFADLGGAQTAWTADRTEFLGRNGSMEHPAALGNLDSFSGLSGRTGAGLDPCAALQAMVKLRAGATTDVVFFLGETADRQDTLDLMQRYRKLNIDTLFNGVLEKWNDLLGAVQVRTPDRAMDILLNRWLLYQTISCRLWARAGFYQAGGAYGFRDQLQDVMATVVGHRELAREQILRAAARQFPEGDVQHWWHPPSGRGVRTRISDDLLWLAYVVSHYVDVTGETDILDEVVPFIKGPELPTGKDDSYFKPDIAPETATLFEHCARALDRSLVVGAHGLPLMGSGDWNDGMNRVGHEGKGESVWLAWFLQSLLADFSKIADKRGETQRAVTWRLHVSALKTAVEHNAWDGEWYKRAFFDNGSPLGSSMNAECRIDSIAQSWGVLSGAADPARAAISMASMEKNLIRHDAKLLLLFTPPFDKSEPSPGYIEGYVPGVRENGGQYTHAAIWSVMAFAALGDGDKAGELFRYLNPIYHSATRADIHRYKVEPYVVAADIYSEAPHVGRGGWTWYTGSASWMLRAGLESLLGFHLRGTTMTMAPCIPRAWLSFELSFRYHSSRYDVQVENPHHVSRGIQSATLDGQPIRGAAEIRLANDGQVHRIQIVLG